MDQQPFLPSATGTSEVVSNFTEMISEIKSKESVRSPEEQGMLALEFYKNEQYGPATEAFQKALEMDPSNAYFKEMLDLSLGNHISEVQVPVPDIYFFEKERLLSVHELNAGILPAEPTFHSGDGFFTL